MLATNIQIATHVSLPVKVMSNADGAKEEHSTTRTMDKPNTNAVVTKMESHSSSPAQEHSKLKTVKVITAIGTNSLAPTLTQESSQMNRHAKQFARQLPGKNAT